jgi:hypothetical protein
MTSPSDVRALAARRGAASRMPSSGAAPLPLFISKESVWPAGRETKGDLS